ncbi:GlsB/YeaQ/YmgE family stress response membrane protein [Ralstonia solanacearum]|uniref:GlsB/YeaQ/YmgE family stress response membrane protein n=1 Tax=Ralstonia solanacearum TaxID=305 RepID=A0AAD0WGQ1_RALSL|nr:GlsB/YeaQ/YmgE family stress response membrane protein [Ralstonia solanacearum]AXV82041.1 GlsB/YeaQ/YmgE family stress response membrane protein [Ralstonia solanacearum]AXW53171.1 GlsB/YeaQ/YmgE family stress response membrane protein [Ralstonia solanacearum]CBJ51679.1 Putative transmembrane protein [Ralstonia solanacearum PSI07]
MHILITIFIGFLAGLIARWITPGSGPSGFILTTVLGIAGALAATFLGQLLHLYQPGQSAGFIGAVIGAVILLAVYHLIARNR